MVEPAAAGCPLLRVVVVTYNSGDSLAGFLDSLGPATGHPVEVVVADNGSADGAPAKAQGRQDVRLLELGTNLGYGRAANAGATAPGGHTPWLLVANPDIVFEPGSLDELLGAASRHPGAAAFGPAIRTPAGQLYPSARNFPSLGRGVGHALVGWLWPANPWTRAYRNEQDLPAERNADWLSGSCLLLRRDAFDEVRGFDPAYFMYCEDMDLCRRLHEAGYECVYVPSALVTHSGGHATRLHSTRMLAEHHRSMYRYLSRQYAGMRYAWLRPLLAAGLLARFAVATRVRRLREGAEPTRSARELGG